MVGLTKDVSRMLVIIRRLLLCKVYLGSGTLDLPEYRDAVGQRSLKDSTFASGSQSAHECIDYCASAGYTLAGTEYR
jgi:hypothetical protein